MTDEEYNARVSAMAAREARHQERMTVLRMCLPCFLALAAAYALGLLTMWLILR